MCILSREIGIRATPGDTTLPQDIEDQINSDALQPQEVEADGVMSKNHDLEDLIKADRYIEGKNASRRSGLGIRRTRMIPPGAV